MYIDRALKKSLQMQKISVFHPVPHIFFCVLLFKVEQFLVADTSLAQDTNNKFGTKQNKHTQKVEVKICNPLHKKIVFACSIARLVIFR